MDRGLASSRSTTPRRSGGPVRVRRSTPTSPAREPSDPVRSILERRRRDLSGRLRCANPAGIRAPRVGQSLLRRRVPPPEPTDELLQVLELGPLELFERHSDPSLELLGGEW